MRLPINAILFPSKQDLTFRGHSKVTDFLNKVNFKDLKLLVDSSPTEINQQYENIKTVFSCQILSETFTDGFKPITICLLLVGW